MIKWILGTYTQCGLEDENNNSTIYRIIEKEGYIFMDHLSKDNFEKYTVEEVSKMENHAELIGGELIIIDTVTVTHHHAVSEIIRSLNRFIETNNSKDEVFSNSVILYCNELCDDVDNLFIPDVMTVSDETGIKDDGVHIAPIFVAEITSEASKRKDYGRKMLIYRDICVKEYWIVDLQRKAIIRYLSENDFDPEDFTYPDVKKVAVHTYPTLEIDLSSIFEYSVN